MTLHTFEPGAILTAEQLNGNFAEIATSLSSHVSDLNNPHQTTDTQISFSQAGAGVVSRTVRSKLREVLSVADFGAVGDNTTPCDAAIAAAFAAAKAQRKRLHFPAGTYLFTTPNTTLWDLTGNEFFGMMITGEGAGNTILRFPNVTSQIVLQIYASSDWYDFVMSDLQIQAQTSTAAVVIGQNSFVDPLNMGNFTNVVILNTLNNSNAEALRLNYVVNTNFIGVRAGCYADGAGNNNGTGLRARQAAFCTFTNGSYGNGTYGVRFTDAFSYGNVFVGVDHENVNYCISNDSGTAGNNTWIGGQLSLWTVAALSASGGLSTNAMMLINCNFSNGASPAPRIDPANFGGIRLIDGNSVSTPTLPTSGGTAANITGKRVLVTFWGGAVTSVSVNGFGIGIAGSGSVVVPHGQTVALNYTGSPNWLWQALE